jgi:phosphinothricin acetyltransferase
MAADLPALLAIYNHYVTNTPFSFALAPSTLEQRQVWFDGFADHGRYQCFVAVKDGAPIGWASSGKFREKAAYQTSIETSVYVAPDESGQGLGRRLYETLFAALASEDVHRAVAVITVPNEASVGLHRAMGFEEIGTFREAGFKFGRYWDVAWFGRAMD